MTIILLVLDLTFLVAAVGLRSWTQWRRSGDIGWRLGRPHSVAAALARGLLTAGVVLIGAAVVTPVTRAPGAVAAGLALAAAALAVVLVAQLQMGSSWRIGVDPAERTALVTNGIYRFVRNPIYAGMAAFAAGQALALSGPWPVVATGALVGGAEVQARLVEEPYLAAVHGTAYRTWAAGAGRFVPGVGRLRHRPDHAVRYPPGR
jgi:protein-S-isoprenylcysteine O-methyltransferase Ste14